MNYREEAERVWIIECHNEWCSGPERWEIMVNRPREPQRCPVCGWAALYGSGIHKVDIMGGIR